MPHHGLQISNYALHNLAQRRLAAHLVIQDGDEVDQKTRMSAYREGTCIPPSPKLQLYRHS
jgi:hypothetical protein